MALSCSSPTKPTPPPTAPVLSCPASQSVVSADNKPVTVTYPKPTLSGGALPVTTVCTPETGASFPLGTSTVSCTATDAQSRTSTCAFSVTVQPALSINATSILAFGDSITEGGGVASTLVEGVALTGVGCHVGTPISYPAVMSDLLKALYPTQAIAAKNCGWSGEEATEGVTRLPTGLATGTYDVVLLLEGANDLNALSSGTQANAVNTIANAIVSMTRTARPGRTVFVGTLTPQRRGGKGPRPEWVEPVNTRLRTVVPQEGAVLVDTWQALGGSPDPYISSDGLHPTAAGYQKIADAFLSAIRSKFESKLP